MPLRDADQPSASVDADNRKWWVLLAVGVGTFMSALDSSVVNIILPIVNRNFGGDVATVEWVITIYLLVVSGLLLSFGRLGDLRGHKQVYVSGFGIFILASMLCGLSTSVLMLVACRAIQAIGAAMLFANSPAILTRNFPAEQRGQALGLQATMTYLGLTVGPSLGGWLAQQFSWRAVFYINVPIGLLALFLSMRFIPSLPPARQGERFDLAGAATFMAGLVCLLFGLNQGQSLGWGSVWVLGALVLALILLASFISIERSVSNPMLDLSLFGNRQFSAATGTAILNYICINTLIFLLPFYLIQGRGLNSAQAGLLLTAQPVIMAITVPLSGTLSDRIGARLLGTLGMAILAVGLFMLSRLGADSPYTSVALGLAVTGLGTGIFISPNSSALMGAAPRNRQGIAAGILATARNVGMVLGVGMAGALFTTIMAQQPVDSPGAGLFAAISVALLVAVFVAILGALLSAVRGQTTTVPH
jgi:EmrB/QacA subfamily drug resistance transporter